MTHTNTQPEALRLAEMYTGTPVVPQGWKLVQIELLERIQESLGSFISDHGWSQSDIDAADALDGLLAEVSAPAAQVMDAADTMRLNWLDAQVKNHAVYNGFLWQECGGWEENRGLVCAIQGKKQKKTVRQAIDAAIAAQTEQKDT